MDCEVVQEALLSFEISKRTLANARPIMLKSMSAFHYQAQQERLAVIRYLKN